MQHKAQCDSHRIYGTRKIETFKVRIIYEQKAKTTCC